MSFEAPLALLGLAAVPAVTLLYALLQRRRAGTAQRFGSAALLPDLVRRTPGFRRHVPPALLLAALALLLVALARPQAVLSTTREEATVVLALDVSFSMAAKDVEPTRLAAAEAAAQAFVDKVPRRFRIAVVAFATRAVVVSPPTDDREVVGAALRALRLGEGTAIGDALLRSLQLVRATPAAVPSGRSAPASPEDVPAAVLLLSDGAQTGGGVPPATAAARARNLGIPVFTVALGTPGGVVERPLPGGFRERIQVPPDPRTLQEVARISGGRFFEAPTADDLREVYRNLGSRLGHHDQKREVTVAFVGAGGLLVLLGGALSSFWFQRLP